MTIKKLTKQVVTFRDERDWKQFHTPKDIALSLLIEASEFAQLHQFKTEAQLEQLSRHELGRELSDVLYWVLLAAHDNGLDLEQEFRKKMRENARKYPRRIFAGSNEKYRRPRR